MLFAIRESLARSHDATDIEALGGREIERDSLSLLALERERLLLSEDNLARLSSRISMRAVPLRASVVVLLMRAAMTALSPWRTKRGMLGCTITFLLATASAWIVAEFICLS